MKFSEMSEEYVARLNDELQLIQRNNFTDYFLVVSDVAREIKNKERETNNES